MDKKPFSSKKFIAFFFSVIVMAGVMITALLTQTFGWPLVTFMSIMALGMTAVIIGYVISQSALDKFIHGAAQIIGRPKDVTVPNKDME